jgi:hypothetical protein
MMNVVMLSVIIIILNVITLNVVMQPNDTFLCPFLVKESERCCISSCRKITNVHPFPDVKEKRDNWIQIMRDYLGDPSKNLYNQGIFFEVEGSERWTSLY